MSDGAFETAKYKTNKDLVVPIRIQPETLTLTLAGTANTAASGEFTLGAPSAQSGGSKRRIGINARTVTVALTADGTGVNAGMKIGSKIRLPVFAEATWDAYTKGSTGTYKGIACKYAGHSDENVV